MQDDTPAPSERAIPNPRHHRDPGGLEKVTGIFQRLLDDLKEQQKRMHERHDK